MCHLSLGALSPTQCQACSRLFIDPYRRPQPPESFLNLGGPTREVGAAEGVWELQVNSRNGGQRRRRAHPCPGREVWRWSLQGALGGLRGLSRDKGRPRLWGGIAAPEPVPIYRHHKTSRAGVCVPEGADQADREGSGRDVVSQTQAFFQIQAMTSLQVQPFPALPPAAEENLQGWAWTPLAATFPSSPGYKRDARMRPWVIPQRK